MFNLENASEVLSGEGMIDIDYIFISKEFELKKVNLNEEVKREIIEGVKTQFNNLISEKTLVDYDPVVKIDGQIDSIKVANIPTLSSIYDKFNDITSILNATKISEINNSKAYAIVMKKNTKKIIFFKKVTSSIYLKSKKNLFFSEGRMKKFNKDILSIDDKFDCVSFESDMLVFSTAAFEQIFDYKDEYTNRATNNINYIESLEILESVELLRDESEKITIKKKLAKLKTENIDWFNGQLEENIDKIRDIIASVGLDITITDNKLAIGDVSEFIHLVQNDYLKSEINNDKFISESKRKICS